MYSRVKKEEKRKGKVKKISNVEQLPLVSFALKEIGEHVHSQQKNAPHPPAIQAKNAERKPQYASMYRKMPWCGHKAPVEVAKRLPNNLLARYWMFIVVVRISASASKQQLLLF